MGIAVLSMAAAGMADGSRESHPTLILHGGIVHTAADAQPVAGAVAIRGDRIVRVGSSAEVLPLGGPGTEVVDLGGAAVVPGFHDAHGHVAGLGALRLSLDLADTADAEEILRLVRERAAGTAPGGWIIGRGWDQNDWPGQGWPDRHMLDRAAPGHLVYLTRVDGHAAWVNSRALALAGVSRDTPDPPGGRVMRDTAGEPTGILVDAAQQMVRRHVPPPDAAALEARVRAADEEFQRLGLTMVHDAGADLALTEIYERLARETRLATRLYVMLANAPATTGPWFRRGPLIDPAHRLTIRAVKLVADGALGSRGAALLEDYADEPGNRGLAVTPADRLEADAGAAVKAGFQPCTHAIGDRANRETLDAYERLMREAPGTRALRPRVEHAQILDAADLPRFGALGIIASMQPIHCTSDMPWAARRLGAGRVSEGAYAWRTLLDSGAVIAAGSDFPVEPPNPLLGFHAAITRQAHDGGPPGGWNPDQRMARGEALRAMTRDAAFAAHAEQDLGTIAPGKLADLVVLSADIMTMPPAQILRTRVLRTIVAGRTTYRAD